jgi:hypothetical protein
MPNVLWPQASTQYNTLATFFFSSSSVSGTMIMPRNAEGKPQNFLVHAQ